MADMFGQRFDSAQLHYFTDQNTSKACKSLILQAFVLFELTKSFIHSQKIGE
jgi:hypothetical protein